MLDGVKIRQALLEDLDSVAPLFDAYRCFYEQASDPDLARDFLRERLALRESVIFLAERRSRKRPEPLGLMQLYPGFSSVAARRLWILNDLFVVSSARGQGIGRALLEASRRYARRTGACRVTLSTASDNVVAQALYEAFGFRRDPDFHYALPVEGA